MRADCDVTVTLGNGKPRTITVEEFAKGNGVVEIKGQ
jgi:hypothetical protein